MGRWAARAWWGVYGALWFHLSHWEVFVVHEFGGDAYGLAGAVVGVVAGAVAGSIVPFFGTVVGAIFGTVVGGILGIAIHYYLLWPLVYADYRTGNGAWVNVTWYHYWWDSPWCQPRCENAQVAPV